jgi:hypothetical protein
MTDQQSMGCTSCDARSKVCGGLYSRSREWDCREMRCCGQREGCNIVCINNPNVFANAWALLGGFGVRNVGRLRMPASPMPRYISTIANGVYLSEAITRDMKWIAVPLRHTIRLYKESFRPSHNDGASLRQKLKVGADTKLIISCVDKDERIEKVWRLFMEEGFCAYLKSLEPAGVIVPNFSVFETEPPTEHAYSRKRSLRVAEELSRQGVPVLPFCVGSSPYDIDQWADFLRLHPEVYCLVKEFQTGLKSNDWGLSALDGIARIQERIGRPVHLVAIGGWRYRKEIAQRFPLWTHISARPFVASTKARLPERIMPMDPDDRARILSNHRGRVFEREHARRTREVGRLAGNYLSHQPPTHRVEPIIISALQLTARLPPAARGHLPPPANRVGSQREHDTQLALDLGE